MNLLEIQNLTFTYPERSHPALNNVSFAVAPGEFVVLCGKSGCGKSTLLRHLKTVLTPHGERSGSILVFGQPLEDLSQREQASRIGFVLQSPENQIVTDKVWHELAFGLESLGEKTPIIRRRVAEMASFFGIQSWYEKSVHELSGGQKQILSLASVLAMQPDVLILDEPTSQLDPIAAEDFVATLKKINDEIGTTIVLSEHRLENTIPQANHVIVMTAGQVVCEGDVSSVGLGLQTLGDPMLEAMPTPVRVYLALEKPLEQTAPLASSCEVPRTVREGRLYLQEKTSGMLLRGDVTLTQTGRVPSEQPTSVLTPTSEPLLKMKDVWFRYTREGQDIVKDVALTVYPGELHCVVGGNGTGKSTMLGVVTGENRYYRGFVRVLGLDPKKVSGRVLSDAGLALLPQDPQTLFTRPTVFDNLVDIASACARRRDNLAATPEAIEAEVLRVCELTDTVELMGCHPYDISGGEQQRVGLAMALLSKSRLLLLDEPTKGMDGFFKSKFAAILRRLYEDGLGVLMVSHDVEFCAQYADRCALFFNGSVVSEGIPRAFFSGNSFYTTAANRMARAVFHDAITAAEIIEQLSLS